LSGQRHEGQRALAQAIRSLRLRFGLSQAELGRRSNIHVTWINRIEQGNIDPTFGNVRRIAAGLGVSLVDLAEEEARIRREPAA
jgi:transcriptional regulator with XRE-family HTH domain